MVVLIVFGILAIVGVIGLYLRDSITSRRISHEAASFCRPTTHHRATAPTTSGL